MPLFSRRKDDPATRDPEDFSGGPGIKNYSDEQDSDRGDARVFLHLLGAAVRAE